MSIFQNKRNEAQMKIRQAIEEVSAYNLTHEDQRVIDRDKFITEIMIEYNVKERTAKEWLNEAIKMYQSTARRGV